MATTRVTVIFGAIGSERGTLKLLAEGPDASVALQALPAVMAAFADLCSRRPSTGSDPASRQARSCTDLDRSEPA